MAKIVDQALFHNYAAKGSAAGLAVRGGEVDASVLIALLRGVRAEALAEVVNGFSEERAEISR